MSEIIYPDCIRELYESEIFGEAASLAILKVAKNEREKYHTATLLQLETETKARLRPFLAKYNLDLTEDMDLSEVEGIKALYLGGSWQEYVKGIIPVVQSFLGRFKDLAELGPEEDKDMLNSMVRHEMAILNWAEEEATGPAETSLNAMIDELKYPLPKPKNL